MTSVYEAHAQILSCAAMLLVTISNWRQENSHSAKSFHKIQPLSTERKRESFAPGAKTLPESKKVLPGTREWDPGRGEISLT